jgi:hypothetical protein
MGQDNDAQRRRAEKLRAQINKLRKPASPPEKAQPEGAQQEETTVSPRDFIEKKMHELDEKDAQQND